MNIIFFTRYSRKAGSVDLSRPRTLALLGAVLVAVSGSLVLLGYQLANVRSADLVADWRSELSVERDQVHAAMEGVQQNLDALTLRLSQAQARILRLDALGERLVRMARLDKGEFDFSQPPAQGGPEEGEAEVPALESKEMTAVLDQLEQVLTDRERQLAVLENMLLYRNLQKESKPAGRPIDGGWISSYFGTRTDPFSGRREFHKGIDFAGKRGSEVRTVAPGVVTWSGKRYGYGLLVEINHGNGYVTRYAHNERVLVKVGETVKKGRTIARMGSTGRSTGPHVHLEVLYHGKAVNPARYIQG